MTQVAGHGVVVDHECVFGWRTGLVADGHRCVRTSRRVRQAVPVAAMSPTQRPRLQ